MWKKNKAERNWVFILLVLHWIFLSISNLSHVIRDFHTCKMGPEVVLATIGGVLKQKWPDGSILWPRLCISGSWNFSSISYRSKVNRVYCCGQEIWHSGSKIWGFREFWPEKLISYQCDPQKALPYSKPRRLSHSCDRLSRLVCRSLQEKR
jgi:hypothetical protein